MTDWDYLNDMARNDLPVMPQAVVKTLDEWMFRTHGAASSAHQVGLFLGLLKENGFTVERSVVAGARSYTTLETAEFHRQPVEPEELTEGRIKAEDPTFEPIADEEPPVRSLG